MRNARAKCSKLDGRKVFSDWRGAICLTSFLCFLALVITVPHLGCARTGEVIVVGSKNFTEQIILGELLARHIESNLGVEVDRRLNLAGSFLCHQAVISGEIDLYVEYTGTAFTGILGMTQLGTVKKCINRLSRNMPIGSVSNGLNRLVSTIPSPSW